MRVINSVQNETIKNIDKLNDKKVRNKRREFIIEGYHLVDESYKHNLLKAVLSINEDDFIKYPNVEHYLINDAVLKKLTKTVNPQGIIGIVKMPSFDAPDLQKEKIKIVMLDSINDPGNLGSIVRTAAALGYDAIYMSTDTVDIYNEKTLRATQGAIFKIPHYYVSLEEIIKLFKNNSIVCLGTTLKNSVDLDEVSKLNKFSICFGNEARGMSEKIISQMDKNIKIKMENSVESLNVLSASSIVMYHLK